jgi:hypothetical protein
MSALGYRRVAAEEGVRWRRPAQRRRRKRGAVPDNAFSALADLLPPAGSPRRRRGRPA